MKFPKSAVFTTTGTGSKPYLKAGGLYLLERNIILLVEEGVKTIHLHLTGDEIVFFKRKIKHRVMKRFPDLTIEQQTPAKDQSVTAPTNIFFQKHRLQQADTLEKTSNGNLTFIQSDNIFEVNSPEDIKRAEQLLTSKIIADTGGIIARNINKRLSIPLSLLICKTRIHPNTITLFNFFIGILSAFFLFKSADTSSGWLTSYLQAVIAGTLFQAASIFDGIDGEVAKMTLRTSKLGGWLDTAVDNISLILLLCSASYVYYRHFGGVASAVAIIVLSVSLFLIFSFLVYYTKNYSETESMTAFDVEVLQKVPQDDVLIQFSNIVKYLVKKELFSLNIFIGCIIGISFLIIPVAAFVAVITFLIIVIINLKYRDTIKKK